MPTRSRQANTKATAQVEDAEARYTIPGLEYTETLSWPAGKPIAVADLFTRLQKLSGVLKDAEQGSVEVKDIATLAQDLAHSNLLGHKDKGIRAWTVTCIVDVLNLCAPNAPYRPTQLKEIFTVIIYTILPALADPSNAYNAQHQYVLDQLVDAQSIVLITDLQDPEALISHLFSTCFDVVSGSSKNTTGMEIAQSVVFQLTMLLNTVVDEASLPDDVVDIILTQFFRVDPRSTVQSVNGKKKTIVKDKSQSTLLLKDYPPAYNLAKSVCTACSDKLSTAVSQYFSTIITSAGSGISAGDGKSKASAKRLQADDSDSDDGDNMKDLEKAHRLAKELWRACPDVLANVVPQIELELAADSVHLRELAVTTVGDLTAGVGLAGMPDLPALDPALFPSPTIENADLVVLSPNPLQKPSAPKPFMHVHSNTYQSFLGRRVDKAVEVRIAWIKAAARILLTRAGGIGLNDDEQSNLVSAYAKMLKDVDDKVRLAALENLETFSYHAAVEVLASDGGLSKPDSLLSVVAERVTDKKHNVRERAILLLGTLWGVASRDIGNGNERVRSLLGQAPTRLLSAMYVKDAHISMKLPEVIYDKLLPLSYPPIKGKVTVSETQGDGDVSEFPVDPDTLRVRRLITLIRDLDEKARPVFFGLQKRQAEMARGMTQLLNASEKYNGGVADSAADEQSLKSALTRYIDSFARMFQEPSRASADLWKFVNANDRRNYQLIKFAMGAEHDYRTIFKAIRELTKRLHDAGPSMASILDTLRPLIYQSAMINYNRSHISAIMELTKSPDAPLADAAQEVLRQISEKVPEVMKSHIQVLCQELEEAAPSEKMAELGSSTDSLKACSAFAKKFPDELPKERKFVTAMQNFALYSGSPASAKYAVTIVLLTSDKKELRSKEMLTKALKRVKAGSKNKVAQLTTIAQICRLAPAIGDAEWAEVSEIAKKTLEGGEHTEMEYVDSAWAEATDDETAAKQMALKIYVNRCRRDKEDEDCAEEAIAVLTAILRNDGETISGDASSSSASVQRNHLRLTAARYILKLCRHRSRYEQMVTPQIFHTVAWILVSPPYGVRGGLVRQLKKYLSSDLLSTRWLTLLFLLPFEPDEHLRATTMAWLKSRLAHYARQQQASARNNGEKKQSNTNVMESIFSRLLSLLAHHPDFPAKNSPEYIGELFDFANYIIFYLRSVSTEENLSLIFHIAQRVKQASDAVAQTDEVDEKLYTLSDLAQATIRNYADIMPGSAKGMNVLQAWPGKAHLPANLFQAIKGSARAQEIASKNYLPEEVAMGLETLVRKSIRNLRPGTSTRPKTATADRKRKSSVSVDLDDDEADTVRKSAKKSRSVKKPSRTLAIRETPNSKKRKSEVTSVEQPSRKSARTSTAKKITYEESDEDEEEEDVDNIVKYNPAPIENYKHKSRERKTATPDIEEEDEDEDVAQEDEAEADEAGSPTPGGKAQEISEPEENNIEEDEDVEMTNGDHEVSVEAGDVDEEATGSDDAEVEDEMEDEEEEARPSPPPAKRGGRTTRAKDIPKSALTSTKKARSTSKSEPKPKATETPASKSKTAARPAKGKVAAPASSPPPESARRSSRRSKAET